jgi:hypothetical protein
LIPLISRHFDRILEGLTEEDILLMRRTLKHIIKNIERNA